MHFSSVDPSSTLSSWLIDHYFTHIYCNQVKTTNKYLQPNSIIGLHDMFIVCQIVQASVTSKEFLDLCKKKVRRDVQHSTLENYNKYLQRCGLNDLIDLFHQCQVESSMNSLTFQSSQVQTDFDRLVFEYLLEQSTQCAIDDQNTASTTAETKQTVQKLIDNDTKHAEQSISKVSGCLSVVQPSKKLTNYSDLFRITSSIRYVRTSRCCSTHAMNMLSFTA